LGTRLALALILAPSIDRHQRLAGLHAVARMNSNLRQRSAHLRLRRDLIVATYSLDWGTGENVTAMVCTGIACIPATAGFFWQPVTAKPRKTKQPMPRMRFNAFFFTLSFFNNVEPGAHPKKPDCAK
jgi:hypothetical protein